MIKEYTVDQQKKKKTVKTQRRIHPRWTKRKNIRTILYSLCVIIPPAFTLYGWSHPEEFNPKGPEFLIIWGYFAISTFFIWLPTLIYCKQLSESCVKEIRERIKESLMLLEDRLQSGYHSYYDRNYSEYTVYEIKYSDIEKLTFNKYHNRLAVFGKFKTTKYDIYEENLVGTIREQEEDGKIKITHYRKNNPVKAEYDDRIKDSDKLMRFYLYYNNNDDFVKTLSERSGVIVEVVNYPEV
jgi:hypothetical protein